MKPVERVADTRAHTGEGPLWHPEERTVYWVDIPVGELYCYDPAAGHNELVYETDGMPLSGFTIEEDGALLLFTHGEVLRLAPTTDTAQVVTEVDAPTRFNDVIADPEGRIFCGTMPNDGEPGDLYRLDTDGTATIVVPDVTIPNGMGFTRDLETFYFTESAANTIYAFDYERSTGELSNKRIFIETQPGDGVPDGLTVDSEDHIWSARWNGNRVVRYDPEGTPVAEIELPARKVSSVTFGGPGYRDLYLTTALLDADRDEEGEGAGALYRVPDVDPQGVDEFRSRVGIE